LVTADPVASYIITEHARHEMSRRGLTVETVGAVLAAPGERYQDRPGRDVLQSLIEFGDPARRYVVRVFVDTNRSPAEVVTAYRSSKIAKYWRGAI
jgi:hypothetical protein